MRDIKADLFDPCFDSYGMVPVQSGEGFGPAGIVYAADSDQGRGRYWVYPQGNLFAISAFDMRFDHDLVIRCDQLEFLSVTYYSAVDGYELPDKKPIRPFIISTHVADDNEEYWSLYRHGSSVVGVTINISPDYYRKRLHERFGDVPDVRKAFQVVDGCCDFPEMVLLLQQVRGYDKGGVAADLFYEGKVAEAISLIMEKARECCTVAPPPFKLSRADEEALALAAEYVRANPEKQLTLETLARIACMGTTKFKVSFKQSFGMSVGAYITTTRMDRAQGLLSETDMTIAEVSRCVGYRKAGSFTDAFRKTTGVLPSVWRDAVGCCVR